MPATYRATYTAHEREPTPDSPITLNELCYTVDGDQVHLEAWLDRRGLEAMGQAIPVIAARLSAPRRPTKRAPAAKPPRSKAPLSPSTPPAPPRSEGTPPAKPQRTRKTAPRAS